MPVKERGEGFVVVGGLVAEQPGGGSVESLYFGQHRQIAGMGQRRPGRKQPPDPPGARIFQPAAVVAHRHRHVGLLGGDPEVVEQPAQSRIRAVIVHQECGVYPDHVAVTAVQEVRMGVSTDSAVSLEQRDPVTGRQHVRRRQPCDSATDDGDGAPAWLISFHTRYSERSPFRIADYRPNVRLGAKSGVCHAQMCVSARVELVPAVSGRD